MNSKQIAKATAYALGDIITVKKRVHPGYTEWIKSLPHLKEDLKKIQDKSKRRAIKRMLSRCYFGKYRYWYENPNGKFSLIRIRDFTQLFHWETYDGEDCTNFSTKKDAEKYIEQKLRGTILR